MNNKDLLEVLAVFVFGVFPLIGYVAWKLYKTYVPNTTIDEGPDATKKSVARNWKERNFQGSSLLFVWLLLLAWAILFVTAIVRRFNITSAWEWISGYSIGVLLLIILMYVISYLPNLGEHANFMRKSAQAFVGIIVFMWVVSMYSQWTQERKDARQEAQACPQNLPKKLTGCSFKDMWREILLPSGNLHGWRVCLYPLPGVGNYELEFLVHGSWTSIPSPHRGIRVRAPEGEERKIEVLTAPYCPAV